MKRSRWVVVAAALAVVVSVSPANGAGKAGSETFGWAQGGVAIPSYAFKTVDSGSHASTNFKLANRARSGSGTFAIHLTGSPAFSIRSTGCTGKSLGARKWCRVTVAYAPKTAGARSHAVLTATREHGTAARLELSGCSADAGHVYWMDYWDGTVAEGVPADGCRTTLSALPGIENATAMAVDDSHIYWATLAGTVEEVPIGGGPVTTLASGQAGVPTLGYPVAALAVDGTNVYWLAGGGYPDYNGTVNEVPIGGGSVTTLAGGLAFASGLAVDGTNVYWTDQGPYSPVPNGTVNEVPIGGGPVTVLAGDLVAPASVATDGTNVYWIDYWDLTVNEVPVGGGSVTTLAGDQVGIDSLAVHGTHVYWTNWDNDNGTVNEVPVGGGSVTRLARHQPGANAVAVNGTHVYWADQADATVRDVRIGGGKVNVIATVEAAEVAVP